MVSTVHYKFISWPTVRPLLIIALIGGLTLFVVWPWIGGQKQPVRTLVVYGFSTLGEVMNQAIFPAFAGHWKSRTGEEIQFISAFAGSGTITNQLILGVPAEVAILSLELDAWRLVDKNVLSGPLWQQLPYGGVINRTPFIILVRPENPKSIGGFEDLRRPGIGVVHPDPLTSGGAQWAILAEYGAPWLETNDPERAYRDLLDIWKNVVAQASSARGARTQFDTGFGDALITYEQEAIYDQARGKLKGQIVYPKSTILSEHIVVVLDKNIIASQRPVVDAFISFLWSNTAQQIFVEYGFRSVDSTLHTNNNYFGAIENPFYVSDLGGWPLVKKEIIDGIWKERVLKEIKP